ncbi:MAG: hypothetical protein NVS3B7_07800 [Candidatus Elarobacter sp.]
MDVQTARILGMALVAAALAACGGGGSGSGYGGPPPATPGPSATASATPPSTAAPAPTATPAPVAPRYTGRVVDADRGNAPVAGATVSLGSSFAYVPGLGYVLAGVTASATTASDGSFAIASAGSATLFQVSSAGYVAAHRPLPAAPSTAIGTVSLPTATAHELAGLNELNANRSKYGSGQGAQPLTLDADVELSARAHVQDEAARGYYGHVAPGATIAFSVQYIASLGGFNANPLFIQENLNEAPGTSGSLVLADDGYIALGPSDGHYQNVISKTNLWVGFGEAFGGKPDPNSTANVAETYFAENFVTSTANPMP